MRVVLGMWEGWAGVFGLPQLCTLARPIPLLLLPLFCRMGMSEPFDLNRKVPRVPSVEYICNRDFSNQIRFNRSINCFFFEIGQGRRGLLRSLLSVVATTPFRGLNLSGGALSPACSKACMCSNVRSRQVREERAGSEVTATERKRGVARRPPFRFSPAMHHTINAKATLSVASPIPPVRV